MCPSGDGYRRCHDPSATPGEPPQFRSSLCDDFQVSVAFFPRLLHTNSLASRHPDDLYKNGIQRSSFIPAIELLKSRFEVTDLDSGTGEGVHEALLSMC